MNPWNALALFLAWMVVACGLGGRYLAGDTNITAAAAVIVALMLTAVIVGVDRADRGSRA
ncbi:hypothetical protein [Mycolicibacterium sp.]|uniref:hypothetical protein n=1 Tax=Mycolicibacterium sp. TaxID=2320850 RepID=UPI0037C5EFE9